MIFMASKIALDPKPWNMKALGPENMGYYP